MQQDVALRCVMGEQKTTPRVGQIRPGGRTSRTRAAVLEAARAILSEHGAGAMRMEEIARRSGVHRSSLYRRWGDVSGIVAELADDISAGLELPDTGSLLGDLEAFATQGARLLDEGGVDLVRAVLAWSDPAIRALLDDFWGDRRQMMATLLARHGSPADPALVLRILAGPIYYEALVEGRAPSTETVHQAATAATRLA